MYNTCPRPLILAMFKVIRNSAATINSNFLRVYSVESATKPLTEEQTSKSNQEWADAKPFSQIPGPTKLSFLVNFLPGGKYSTASAIGLFRLLNKEYGNLVRLDGVFGRQDQIIAFDPDIVRSIFQKEGQWPERLGMGTLVYYKEKERQDIFQDLGGLITDNGERWAYMRKLTNPLMMNPKNVLQYVPQIDAISTEFIERVRQIRDANTMQMPKDFRNELARWALESVGVIGFNTRLGLLNPSKKNEIAEKFIGAVRRFFELAYELDVRPSIWKYYKTKKFKEIMEVYNTMTNCSLHYVDIAKKKLDQDPTSDKNSILVQLLEKDPRAAVIMVHDMLFAGVDTTSFTVANIMYALAKNQDKQDILRKEIMRVLPNKDSPITEETMKNLPYLRSVIKETLRMYNIVLNFARTAPANLVIEGYQVPKGTIALLPHLILSNDPKNFPSPGKFLPERWLREDQPDSQACPHARLQNPFAYIPFGYGVRMCVGKRIAQLEMETLILRLIRNFRVEWNYGEMQFRSELLYIPANDLCFTLRDIE